MKNKSRMLMTLLLSVLMVCSAFVIANADQAATDTKEVVGSLHTWQIESQEGYVTQFKCNKTHNNCGRSEWDTITLTAEDAVYDATEYDYSKNASVTFGTTKPGTFSFGAPKYYDLDEEEELADAPVIAGHYSVCAELIIEGNGTDLYVKDDFEIKPVDIEVTMDDQKKKFEEADPELTFTVTKGSLAEGDTEKGLFIIPDRKTGDDIGTYEITGKVSTLMRNKNYNITKINPGTLTIEKASEDAEAVLTVNKTVEYGTDYSEFVKVGATIISSEDYTLEYKSLDSTSAKWKKGTPSLAGHYRLRATLPATENYDEMVATADLEITKVGGDLNMVAVAVSLDKLVKNDITDKTVMELIFEKLGDGIIVLDDGAEIPYGYRLGTAVFYGDGVFKHVMYDPARMGKLTLTYEAKNADGQIVKKGIFKPGITQIDAGLSFNITAKVAEGRNNWPAEKSLGWVTVNKADPTIVREPVANDGLVFNDTYQRLVTPGSAKGGVFKYSLEEDGVYSNAVPKVRDAGEYTVWYKVDAVDSNYNSIEPQRIDVAIAEEDEEPTQDPEKPDTGRDGLSKPTCVKVAAGKKAFTVSWCKPCEDELEKFDKFEIQYSRDKNFKTSVKKRFVSKKKSSYKASGLKKGAMYYVRIRSVKYNSIIKDGKVVLGEKIKLASDWTTAKKIKVK